MHKVSLQNAVKMTGKSESTLRRDVKKGKVSAVRDDRGHLRFDIAELQRAYGELQSTGDDAPSTEQGNGKAMTGHDSAEIIAIKDNQIADLRNQLERAEMREDTHIAERKELHDRLAAEQEKTRLLMLPKPEPENEGEKPRGWLQRLIGAS